MQFWITLIIFMFGKKNRFFGGGGGGGLKIQTLFSNNFLDISNNFDFFYFPGGVGWVGENEIKANLSQNWSFSLGLAELGNTLRIESILILVVNKHCLGIFGNKLQNM